MSYMYSCHLLINGNYVKYKDTMIQNVIWAIFQHFSFYLED